MNHRHNYNAIQNIYIQILRIMVVNPAGPSYSILNYMEKHYKSNNMVMIIVGISKCTTIYAN